MSSDADRVRRLTHALRGPETAVAAVDALRGLRDRAAVEGLVELVYQPPSARAALAAIAALEGCAEAIALDALCEALGSIHASVRIAAVRALRRRNVRHVAHRLLDILRQDEAWIVRRAALEALADDPDPDRWQVLAAATDPHWRVRHALIQVLLPWGKTEATRTEIDERLARAGDDARARGVRAYLHHRWSGGPAPPVPEYNADHPLSACGFWDWDAAVLARNLERMGKSGRRQALEFMPPLLGHADERVRGLAGDSLRLWGKTPQLVQVAALLDEPRGGAAGAALQLLGALDLDRAEAVARFILHLPAPSPAQLTWAVDQAGVSLPFEDEETRLADLTRKATAHPARVRRALARLAARWPHPDAESWLVRFLDDEDSGVRLEALRGLNRREGTRLDETTVRRLLDSSDAFLRAEAVATAVVRGDARGLPGGLAQDGDPKVRARVAECLAHRTDDEASALLARLQSDPHPHVRAAALTPAVAAELVKEPARETSWHVLARAAHLRKVPFWELEPDPPWQPAPRPPAVAGPLHPECPAPPHARRLGPDHLAVSPMGISGHYGFPVEGFVRAAEAGVNLLFWQPNYQTLTDFLTRLPASGRNAFHLLSGTFEADGKRVRRDAERVLRLLKIDRVAIFLLFWVQSWDRITPDVREALERLKEAGKIGTFGLSTHARPLAVEAMEAGWDPVMVRHSAAHRGAEERVFPRAVELGTSLITFNNTCYGRLLQPHGGQAPPRAADCYRYTLAQPGVRACWSAPATLEELDENLVALRDPVLPDDRRARLVAHGERVYQEDTIFRRLVRAR
jgi:HEAT repeat protein